MRARGRCRGTGAARRRPACGARLHRGRCERASYRRADGRGAALGRCAGRAGRLRRAGGPGPQTPDGARRAGHGGWPSRGRSGARSRVSSPAKPPRLCAATTDRCVSCPAGGYRRAASVSPCRVLRRSSDASCERGDGSSRGALGARPPAAARGGLSAGGGTICAPRLHRGASRCGVELSEARLMATPRTHPRPEPARGRAPCVCRHRAPRGRARCSGPPRQRHVGDHGRRCRGPTRSCSFTPTAFPTYGAGVVIEELDLVLNNRPGRGFRLDGRRPRRIPMRPPAAACPRPRCTRGRSSTADTAISARTARRSEPARLESAGDAHADGVGLSDPRGGRPARGRFTAPAAVVDIEGRPPRRTAGRYAHRRAALAAVGPSRSSPAR